MGKKKKRKEKSLSLGSKECVILKRNTSSTGLELVLCLTY